MNSDGFDRGWFVMGGGGFQFNMSISIFLLGQIISHPDPSPVFKGHIRDGKRYKRYKRCWCKKFPTGVKHLVENVIKTAGKQKCLSQ